MPAGEFSTSALAEIKLKADQIFSGETAESAFYVAEVEAIKAIKDNQTARIVNLEGYQEKDHTVGINWIDATGVQDQADDTSCDIDEAELETKAIPVELSLTRKAGFSVDEGKLRKSIFSKEEVVAKGLLTAMKELDEYVAVQAILAVNNFSGTPVAGSNGRYTYDATSKTIQIPAAEMNSKIIPYLSKTAILNRIRDSFVLDNGELFEAYENARYNAGNAEGKGDQARFNSLKMYFDMFNFAASGVTPDSTYLIGKNAMAFAHKVRYTSSPIDYPNDQKRYSIKSKNIPGVEYEVVYQLKCVNDELKHVFRLRFKGGFYQNPTAVAGNTGILAFAPKTV